MKWFVFVLKSVAAVDGAVGCHAVVAACGAVGSVVALFAKFAPPAPVQS